MEKQQLEQIPLFDEVDTYSKKRISLHKVKTYEPVTQRESYEYHMVIIDLTMTINLTVSENAIINLVNSLKP